MNVTGDLEAIYGNHEESQLLSNICGHNICCDRFGWSKPSDNPQRTCHGEAAINLYALCPTSNDDTDTITFSTTLNAAKLNMIRSFTFNDSNHTISVSTTMESAMSEKEKTSRSDIEWCEHVTFGDPFLNGAKFTANVDNGYNFANTLPKSRFNTYKLGERLTDNKDICVEDLLSMPLMTDKSIEIEEVTSLRVQDNDQNIGIFNVQNEELGFEMTYKWNNKVFPWLAVWTEHYGRHHPPWNALERTRGMEFATKVFPIAELERHDILKDSIYEQDGRRMFEGRPIEFELWPQGRTETFEMQWKRLNDDLPMY